MRLEPLTHIMSLEKKEIIETEPFLINLQEDDFFILRTRLREEILFKCLVCNEPLRLSERDKTKFFYHPRDPKNNCPCKTESDMTKEEILAMKYRNTRESYIHIQNKNFIADRLRSKNNFTNIEVEKVISKKFKDKLKSLREGAKSWWRRPDVNAFYIKINTRIAFEIQISTTFLDVILEREKFYKENKMFIMWLFDDRDQDQYRFTENDIHYNNNYNSFQITQETKMKSEKYNNLFIKCLYHNPYIDTNTSEIKNKLNETIISIDKLNFNESDNTIYFFDYKKEKELLKNKISFSNKWKDGKYGSVYKNIMGINYFINKNKRGVFYIKKGREYISGAPSNFKNTNKAIDFLFNYLKINNINSCHV